jgi:hypothetical protein
VDPELAHRPAEIVRTLDLAGSLVVIELSGGDARTALKVGVALEARP